ncbi:hypothetical protein IWX90DRAFT_58600 [Phyllosticta citrichinensis]|uniref:CorA-like Mg2+ transporter protein n=1 Tax=Phyllosticta citrichinensis TaxID=1130410 RepID=A0ABR1XH73_9PEZI
MSRYNPQNVFDQELERRPRFTSITQRLAADLAQFDPQIASKPNLLRFIRERSCQNILDDEYEILMHLEERLQSIDVRLGDPSTDLVLALARTHNMGEYLRTDLDALKLNMGKWRSHIFSSHILQWHIQQITKDSADQHLQETLEKFGSKLNGSLRHYDSSFTALIGTMSINESTRAISQAEEATKLTQLAFFFIPLTFVVGVFSMNFEELTNLNLWVWAVTSVSLLVITYSLLYPTAAKEFFKYGPFVLLLPVSLPLAAISVEIERLAAKVLRLRRRNRATSNPQ